MAIRTRVERFLALLARNTTLRKRIEDARAQFNITNDLLSDLRLNIVTVEEKQKLITDVTSNLERARTDLKTEL